MKKTRKKTSPSRIWASVIFSALIAVFFMAPFRSLPASTSTITAAQPTPTYIAGGCQTFPETGFTVCGRFLEYWKLNGGVTQQGFPISGAFEEQNQPPPAGDGKVHKVQYFQRARFEEHLENSPPFDVL